LYITTSEGENPMTDSDKQVRAKIVDILLKAYKDVVPKDFCYNGQSFEERCDGWASNAMDELDHEISDFEEWKGDPNHVGDGPSDYDDLDDEDDDEDDPE
jgi:hypothetical protein